MASNEEIKAQASSESKNISGDKIVEQKRSKYLKILVPVLIVIVAAVLFLLKNPIGTPAETTIDPAKGEYASAEFDLDATDSFDLEKTLSHGLPVIVDFGADSCDPCKRMAPLLVELNQELRGKAVVKFVDVWKNGQAAADLPVQAIPTQFFFNADGSPYVPADIEAATRNGFMMYEMKDTGEHVYTVHQGYMSKEDMLAVLEEMGME